jgi:hypothetical protein
LFIGQIDKGENSLMQKTLSTLALFAALLFSACGEDSILNNANERDENVLKTPSALEIGQEIYDMEPFDAAVFNIYKAAWEANHPNAYNFYHDHRRSQADLHTGENIIVVDDIPRVEWPISELSEDDIPGLIYYGYLSVFSAPGENWLYPFVFCHTISELYEKINALWTEQYYENSAFLIKYDSQLNYPTDIQIKNIYNSGYDYLVQIKVDELDRDHINDPFVWGGLTVSNIPLMPPSGQEEETKAKAVP